MVSPADDRHRRNQRKHAKRRALERHGLVLNKNLRSEIVAAILSGRGQFAGLGHRAACAKWTVVTRGRLLNVVYDWRTGEICTVLP